MPTFHRPHTLAARRAMYLLLVVALLLSTLALPGQFLPSAFAGDPDNPLQLRELGVCADAASRGGSGGLGVLSFGLGIDDTRFDAYNGDFTVSGLTASTVISEAWLYWNGNDTGNAPEDDPALFVPNPGNPPDGDPTVTLQALPAGTPTQVANVTRIGGPAFWATSDFSYGYVADVSAIVTGNGDYRLAGVDNLDNYINGAELVIVYRDLGRDPYYLGIAEGMDVAEGNTSPSQGPGTKAVVYQFEPAQIARTAEVTVFLGGAGFAADGLNSFWYRSDVEANLPMTPTDTSIIGDPLATEIVDPFDGTNNQATPGTPAGASGGYWDSVTFPVNIPAGDSWLAVQVESQDTTPTLDRIEWMGALMNMPLACPEIVVTKTRTTPDLIQPGDAVSYEIVVENVGNTDIVTATLQDTYDTIYLDFDSAVPSPDSALDDGVLDWATGQGIGPIAYSGSVTITVNFTAAASTEPIVGPPPDRTINTATVTGITDENGESDDPGNYPPDDPGTPEDENPFEDTADVEITSPGLTISKSIVTPASGSQLSGYPIVFDVVVTNSGDTAWDVIPLSDVYTTTHLTYNTATLPPVSPTDDGQLDWTDITGAGSLDPGDAITVTLTFTANNSTTGLPNDQDFNVAGVSNPVDENGDSVPDIEDDEPFQVLTPASLGNRVWVDMNGNGIQNGGEPNLSGVTVNLYSTADLVTPIATDTTDGSGIYGFADLFPGDYVIEFVQPGGYEFTAPNQGGDTADSDANTTTGRTTTITLSEGVNDDTWDAGLYQLLDIGDFVWEDINGDGIQTGEAANGLEGVTVTLSYAGPDGIFGSGDDPPAQTDVTDASGAYLFANQPPGNYRLTFATLPGYVRTVQDSIVPGASDANDSDADTTTGETAVFAATSGNDDLTRDAGLYRPASLGNFVWEDLNGNGIQTGESANGVQGVTVTLTYAGPDGVFGNGDDFVHPIETTNSSGAYAFVNLPPGNYRLTFATLPGYVRTLQDSTVPGATDLNDSDANTTTGQTATITLVSGENDPTWDAGLYRLLDIGDFVWEDINGDGIQTGEAANGLQGVTVTLTYAGPDGIFGSGDDPAVPQTDVSDASGAYLFPNQPPGNYRLTFATLPGYVRTVLDSTVPGASDANDSDADTTTGQTTVFAATSGSDDLTRDAGLYQLASLGDYVWIDSNGNGVQDESPPTPLSGVDVDLLYAGPDGIFGNGDDVAHPNDTTNFSGAYGFSNLPPGNYRVTFNAFGSYEFTGQDQGVGATADEVDSDANPATGQTTTIFLPSGVDDPTWDAGLYIVADISGQVREDTDGDGNLADPDAGISGVQVVLWTDPDGNPTTLDGSPFMTTTTDASGLYTFTGVAPGDYMVVETDPAGFDSTADVVPPNDNWVPVTHVSNVDSTGNDFLDAELVDLGDFVWEDFNGDGVQNDGAPSGLDGVDVDLHGAGQDGIFGTGDDYTASTSTAGGGFYLFTDLFPGTYVVTFTAPSGYVFTLQDSTLPGGNDATDSDPDPATGQTGNVVLTSGNDDLTVDAGLYRPITLGDTIFRDANGNTTQDVGENDVVANVPITATNLTTGQVFTTTSDSTAPTGNYLFTGLPPGLYSIDVPATLPLLVRTTPLPAPFLMQSGTTDLSKDFGYINPTAVEIANVEVSTGAEGITLNWQTTREAAGDSFNIYRAASEFGVRKLITLTPIAAYGNEAGSAYTFLDATATPGSDYYYWLEISPQATIVGPIFAPFRDDPGDGGSAHLFIPLVIR